MEIFEQICSITAIMDSVCAVIRQKWEHYIR